MNQIAEYRWLICSNPYQLYLLECLHYQHTDRIFNLTAGHIIAQVSITCKSYSSSREFDVSVDLNRSFSPEKVYIYMRFI
jgi:hypothetical protein